MAFPQRNEWNRCWHWPLIKFVVLVSIMSIYADAFQSLNVGSRATSNMLRGEYKEKWNMSFTGVCPFAVTNTQWLVLISIDPAMSSMLFGQRQETAVAHKGKRSNRKKSSSGSISSKGLSEAELRHHVSAKYVNGPGGRLRPTLAKRRKWEDKKQTADEQAKQLHKLDRHPALVLNADYQVRIWHRIIMQMFKPA